MSREAYDAIKAENFSMAKHILDSPAKYVAERNAVPSPEDELKYVVGTLVHAMSLEGKNLLDLYAIKPAGMSFSTKEGKAWRAAQKLPILKEEDANRVPRMAEAICEHRDAARLLAACPQREKIVMGRLHGVDCKSLFDGLGHDEEKRRLIVDLKTTGTDVLDVPFAKKILDLRYDMQMSWYQQILAIDEGLDYRPLWAWIVVGTAAPFEVEVYYPPAVLIESGERKVEQALTLLKKCRKSGEWPKRSTGEGRELKLDPWMRTKFEEAA